jgi:FkbM family methyltransferase
VIKSGLKRLRPLAVPFVRKYLQLAAAGRGGPARLAARVYGMVQAEQFDFEVEAAFGARIAGNTRDLIQRYIYYFGCWEPDLGRLLGERLRPGDVFVDVGANIGYFTLMAARLVGERGRVVSLEASPSIHAMLEASVALNGAANVRVLNVAVADAPGQLQVFRATGGNSGETSLLPSDRLRAEATVRAAPLDEILDADEMARARLVKIDVEGAEWLVLKGMRTVLRAGRADLEVVTEVSPSELVKHGATLKDYFELFRAHGFHPYRLENDYSPARYLDPTACHRPQRLRDPSALTAQADIVFSRRDVESL